MSILVATVNVAFKDAKNKESFTRIRIPSTFTFLQYKAFGAAAAAVLKAMTTCEITEVSISVGLDLSGASLKTVATQFADWFNKAHIQAVNAVSGLFAKFQIPTYDDANNMAGSRNLDLADAEVAALVTLIEDGVTIGAGLVYPVTVRDEATTLVTTAEEMFRKS
jgi:hypothetical protein